MSDGAEKKPDAEKNGRARPGRGPLRRLSAGRHNRYRLGLKRPATPAAHKKGVFPWIGRQLMRLPFVKNSVTGVKGWVKKHPSLSVALAVASIGYTAVNVATTAVAAPTFFVAEWRRHTSLAADYKRAEQCNDRLDRGGACTRREILSLRLASENEALRCGGWSPPCFPDHFARYARYAKSAAEEDAEAVKPKEAPACVPPPALRTP